MNEHSKELFSHIQIGEFCVFRTFTPSGMFFNRIDQARNIIEFPNLSGSNEIKESFASFVYLRRPLTSLVIFLSVVALEDYIRSISKALSEMSELQVYFPKISNLSARPQDPKSSYSRKDRDFIETILNPEVLNKKYSEIFSAEVIAESDFAKLRDLVLIRHIVAHNGSIVREIDSGRFQHYQVPVGVVLNPSVEFANEVRLYIYKIGRSIELKLIKTILKTIKNNNQENWERLKITKDLIELFNWFGKLGESQYNPDPKVESANYVQSLFNRCIEDIKNEKYE